ncbi:MAG: tetratricopeptide repeat protein [Pseudomonadota bacterium]
MMRCAMPAPLANPLATPLAALLAALLASAACAEPAPAPTALASASASESAPAPAESPAQHAAPALQVAAADSSDDGGESAASEAPTPRQRDEAQLYLEAVRSLSQGRPDEASQMLTRLLERNAQHAGAWLDLAISQCELGNAAEAERLFSQIGQRFTLSQAIVDLIQSYRERGCKVQAATPAATISYKIARGYDTNVNQGASSPSFTLGSGADQLQYTLGPESLPQSDSYSLLSADYLQPLGAGIQAIGQLRLLHHDSVHQQDTSSLLAGLERPWQIGNWRGRGTAVLGLVQLQGVLYQKQAQIQLRATPPVPLKDEWNWSVIGGLSRVEYPTRNYYDASTLDLGTNLAWHGKRSDVVLSFGGLYDRGQAARPGGNRRGWYGGVQYYTRLGSLFNGELGWNRQRWLSDSVYSADLIDMVRRQDTRQLRAALVMPLGGRNSLQLEARQIHNRENISLFQYNSRMIQLSWRHDEY